MGGKRKNFFQRQGGEDLRHREAAQGVCILAQRNRVTPPARSEQGCSESRGQGDSENEDTPRFPERAGDRGHLLR